MNQPNILYFVVVMNEKKKKEKKKKKKKFASGLSKGRKQSPRQDSVSP